MTTRRMVYATIANAVLEGMPEPQSQEFGPGDTVWLRFDSHDDARLWARWHSDVCLSSFYTSSPKNGQTLECYFGDRPEGFRWSIVGKRAVPTAEQVTVAALSPDTLIVRCPRCGHDEQVHETGDTETTRCCLDCGGFCSPAKMPVGVVGWGIDGRTAK